MKKLKLATLLIAAMIGMGSAHAVMLNISNTGGSLVNGIAFGSIPSGGSVDNLFDYLVDPIIPGYNSITSSSLVAPIKSTGIELTSGLGSSINLTGYSYATVHYGGGQGGGMHVFYYLNGVTSYTFAASGSGVGDGTGTGETFGGGPNTKYIGTGGISNVRLWKSTPVPDSGNSLILLGLGLGILGFLKRRK